MPTIQNRRATAAQWTAANPVLAPGEIGFEIDSNAIKIGDGLTPWKTLPYLSDEALSELVESGRLSEAVLNDTYVDQAIGRGLSFAPCTHIDDEGVGDPTDAANPQPVAAFGDYIYATKGSDLLRSTSMSGPWETFHTFTDGGGYTTGLRETGDGEVIAMRVGWVWRSSGWSTDPLTATWTQVLDTAGVAPRSFSVSEHKPLGWIGVTCYVSGSDMSNSRWVWLSKDYGLTWQMIYDSAVEHPDVDQTTSHMHTVAFDHLHNPVQPRIWVVWHKTSADPTMPTDPRNVMTYSDDAGATWTDYSTDDIHPLVMFATEAGMVHDTDSINYGASLLVVDRKSMETRRIFRRRTTEDITNLWSWVSRVIEGTDPGTFHVLWRSMKDGTPAGVTTTDGVRTVETVTIPAETPTNTVDAYNLMLHKGNMIGSVFQTHKTHMEWFQVREPRRGLPPAGLGNLEGGEANDQSVAVGLGSTTTDTGWRAVVVGQNARVGRDSVAIGYLASLLAFRGVAIGVGASGGQDSVVVGHGSASTGSNITLLGEGTKGSSRSVSVGSKAEGTAGDSTAVGTESRAGSMAVAIGKGATATSLNTVVVGAGSSTGQGGVVVGQGVTTSGVGPVAIGQEATAGAGAVAIGQLAAAAHQRSVALGSNTTTNTADQVQVGPRHVEVQQLTADPIAPAAGRARWFVRDNGGKAQLCVRFPTGAVQVLATEP